MYLLRTFTDFYFQVKRRLSHSIVQEKPVATVLPSAVFANHSGRGTLGQNDR
jgi:hypothetical protein